MDTTDSLIARIKKTGYPLEIEVSSFLDKYWNVINTDTYVDRSDNKIKDIDINASRFFQEVVGHIDFTVNLSIECKKSDYLDWVFFTRPLEKSYLDVNGQYLDGEQRFCQSFNTITCLNLLLESLKLHYWDFDRVAVCYKEFIKQSADDRNEAKDELKRKPIFEAQSQIKNYVYDHIMVEMKGEGFPFFVTFYFPCIVFDGSMYEAIVEKGNISLKETKHVLLSTSIPSKSNESYMKYLVDVVHKDYLPDYLKKIKSDVQKFISIMEERQDKVENIIGSAYSIACQKWLKEQGNEDSAQKKTAEADKPKADKPTNNEEHDIDFDPEKLDWHLRMP